MATCSPPKTATPGRNAAPTLRRPGEVLDTPQVGPGMGKVKMPTDQQHPAQPFTTAATTGPR